ncbi:MAG: hypothetical protein EPO21_11750 [Chloroflexota bacterium]|nr:MAG: hypothetical protein EPO21_11750 [Chloroflexota bacterium]
MRAARKITVRALIRILAVLVLGLGAAGAFLSPSPFAAAPVLTEPSVRTIPYTNVHPLGANFFLDQEVEFWKKEQTLKMAHDAGLGWIKQMFAWVDIEPQKGVFWDEKYMKSTWEKFDAIVSLAEKYDLRIIARLDKPPAWAVKDPSIKSGPPRNLEDFGNYVYNVVSHYKGRIQFYQIWNEPNLAGEWQGEKVDAVRYVEMLKIAYRRAKEADPNVVILSAPLAQTLDNSGENVSDLSYLDTMYRAGAKDYFDILSANAYGFDRPPHDEPSESVLNFRRVELMHDIMVRSGDAQKPIWLNEFGWNAAPASTSPDRLTWGRVTEQQQAEYTREAIQIARTWEWLGVINLWYFRQVGQYPLDSAEYYFRLVDVDFVPRLAYQVLKDVSASLRVAGPGYHEETDPAVDYKGVDYKSGWQTILLPNASGRTVASSSTPGDSLSFVFRGTGVNLMVWKNRAGGRLIVRIDGAPAPLLPRDSSGQAYIDLLSTSGDYRENDSVARGLAPGRHTVDIRVGDASSQSGGGQSNLIDGFEVFTGDVSPWPFWSFAGMSVVGLLTIGASWFPRRRR